jgi:hypothetical protein
MSGIPAKSGLTEDTQRELAWWIAKGVTKDEAARRAGLPSTARLFRYMRTKGFAADLRDALNDRLAVELAPKAIKRLEAILDDDKVSSRVVVDAAKAVLDRSGYVATPAPSAPDGLAALENLSIDELRERIALLEQERGLRARVIGGAGAETGIANFLA